MEGTDLFAVVGCPPTLDRDAVKRAYFGALARHPPHTDPEGFRRLRAAYERLLAPGCLEQAYLAAPVDIERELGHYHGLDQALAERATAIRDERARHGRLSAWIEQLSAVVDLDQLREPRAAPTSSVD